MSIKKLMAGRPFIMLLIMVKEMLSSTCYQKELMWM